MNFVDEVLTEITDPVDLLDVEVGDYRVRVRETVFYGKTLTVRRNHRQILKIRL